MIPGIVASVPFSGVILPAVTWNPADKHAGIALSGGDLTATKTEATNAYASLRATHAITGKKYFEVYISNTGGSNYIMVGAASSAMSLAISAGADVNSWSYYQETGQKFHANVGEAYGANFTGNGAVIGVAVDMDAGAIEFYKNGISQGVAYTSLGGTLYPAASLWRGSGGHVIGGRFKLSSFTYAPPAGYDPMGA